MELKKYNQLDLSSEKYLNKPFTNIAEAIQTIFFYVVIQAHKKPESSNGFNF